MVLDATNPTQNFCSFIGSGQSQKSWQGVKSFHSEVQRSAYFDSKFSHPRFKNLFIPAITKTHIASELAQLTKVHITLRREIPHG
jgi:hypothetical protein